MGYPLDDSIRSRRCFDLNQPTKANNHLLFSSFRQYDSCAPGTNRSSSRFCLLHLRLSLPLTEVFVSASFLSSAHFYIESTVALKNKTTKTGQKRREGRSKSTFKFHAQTLPCSTSCDFSKLISQL